MNLVAIITMITIALLVWFIRLTKPDKPKKLKIVHRLDQDATLFV